jgi:hypothetical protein
MRKMKVFYDGESDKIVLYLGKSSMYGFSRYMLFDSPTLGVCSLSKDLTKRLIYIGML